MTATTAQIQIDALIGASVVVSRVKVSARIQIDQILGSVSLRTGKPRSARLAVQAILGSPRLFADTGDNPWVRYGLPTPLQDSYSYQSSEKLVRTQMLSGYTRQRRMWRDGYRKASVTLALTRTQLVSLEEFLDEIGGDWFKMPLVTGDNPTRVAADHRVRVIGDHSVSDVDWQMVRVTLPLELVGYRSQLVTTPIYPLEVSESTGTEAGVPFNGVLFPSVFGDSTGAIAPAPFTGELRATTISLSELDLTSITAPAPFSGTLIKTTLHADAEPDFTSTYAPAPFIGVLERTTWHMSIQESTGTTAPAPFTGTLT